MDYKILNKPRNATTKKTSQILERISYIEETNEGEQHHQITALKEEIQQLKDFNWILLDKLDSQHKQLQGLLQDIHKDQKNLLIEESISRTKEDFDPPPKEVEYQKLESQLYAQQLLIEELDQKILKELKSIKGQQLALNKEEYAKKQQKKWYEFWKK